MAELQEAFSKVDVSGNGFIHTNDLTDVLKAASLPLPGYKARELIQNLTTTRDGRISFDEFISVSKMPHRILKMVPRAHQRHKHRVSWAPSLSKESPHWKR